MPRGVDFSATSKEVGSGNNETDVSKSAGLAKDGSGMTPLRTKGQTKTKSDEKLGRLTKPTFRE
jgi:hypothetical protein